MKLWHVARDYCLKHRSASNRLLARMLMRDYPQQFPTLERARNAVRYYRGAHGRLLRNRAIHSGSLVERFVLPESEPPTYAPYNLPDNVERWLILADMHSPFHDNVAIALAMQWGRARRTRCDGLILLGDFLDNYNLSPFARDPRVRRYAAELATGGALLDSFKKNLKPKRILWRESNHEYRLQRLLMNNAALMDLNEQPNAATVDELRPPPPFSLRAFMDLDKRGITWIDFTRPLHYRALTLLHGDEWGSGTSTPVNPARTAYLKANLCCVIGHFHRTSEHTEINARDETITAWSMGCLCELHPTWRRMPRWNWGFACLATGGGWRVENYRIVKGEIV